LLGTHVKNQQKIWPRVQTIIQKLHVELQGSKYPRIEFWNESANYLSHQW
jgi:hypothetical protein